MLRHIRKHHPVFRGLSRRAWCVFQGVSSYVQKHDYAYPTQATLAGHTGYSVRTIGRGARELRLARALVTWSTRRADGRVGPLHYAYGPAAHEAFADVAASYPRGPLEARAKPLPRTSPAPSPRASESAPIPAVFVGSPSDKMAGGPSDKVADKLEKRFKTEPSSCEGSAEPPAILSVLEPSPEAATPPEEEVLVHVSGEDREIAREALTRRAARKNPRRAAPTWWDRSVVELVAVRVAQTPGSREEKLEAQTLAIAGAFLASRDRAPTVRFIWGEQEHFLEHVERGRKKARNDAWQARKEAEAKGGGRPHPLLPLGALEAVQAPVRGPESEIGAVLDADAPSVEARAVDAVPCEPVRVDAPPAEWARSRREEKAEHVREDARELAQKRAEAMRAAAALAASWGEDEPSLDGARFREARREIEAELAELRARRPDDEGAPPPS